MMGLDDTWFQTRDNIVTQLVVPTEFISHTYDNSRWYISDFNTVCSDASLNIFDKQMMLNHVHDNVIYLIERTLNYIDKILKQKNGSSINHKSVLVQTPDKITISRLCEAHSTDEGQ